MSDCSAVALGLWLVAPGARRPGIPRELHPFPLLPGPPPQNLLSQAVSELRLTPPPSVSVSKTSPTLCSSILLWRPPARFSASVGLFYREPLNAAGTLS